MTEQVPAHPVEPGGYRRLLRDRPFWPYFVGEGVSSVGDAMSEVAIVLVAMSLVSEELWGPAIAAATVAYLLPGLVTGVFLGRRMRSWSPRSLLVFDSLWRFGAFAVVGLLHEMDRLSLPVLVVCLAVAAVSKPAGVAGAKAIMPQLVGTSRLVHANSLLGVTVQGATMIGPAMAGVVAAVWAPVTALVVDGTSFLALAIGAWWSGHVIRRSRRPAASGGSGHQAEAEPEVPPQGGGCRPLSELIRACMPVFATTGAFHLIYGAFVVALPLLAAASSQGDDGAALLGVMWSCFGVGAVLSGLLAPRFPGIVRPTALPLMALGWGMCMCLMAVVSVPWMMVAVMVLGGLAYGPYTAVVATLLQRDLPARELAEAGSYYGVLTSTASPVGIMLAGFTATALEPTMVMGGAGICLVVLGVGYTIRLWSTRSLALGAIGHV